MRSRIWTLEGSDIPILNSLLLCPSGRDIKDEQDTQQEELTIPEQKDDWADDMNAI